MADRDAIVRLLDETLRTGQIKDSSCNGLQVQGAEQIRRVGLAVDACLEAYEKAAAQRCQMLIVHHGLIWRGLTNVTGRNYKHVRYLIEHDLNLYASHLPLDMHEQYGNNILLARMLALKNIQPFGNYHDMMIGFQGQLPKPASLKSLADNLSRRLGGKAMILPHGVQKIRSVGIVSGGAGDMIEQSAAAKLDCCITGEPVHFAYQLARDLGSNVLFLGHYHSEKLGVQALGKLLTDELGVQSVFLDIGSMSARQSVD